jgi:hypothetical protein
MAESPHESADTRPDERSLRLDLVCYGRAISARAALQAEILILRHQLNVLRRRSPKWPSGGSIACVCRALSIGL